MLVITGSWPKLAHLVLVKQTLPWSPPLHSIAVVDERQTSPGGAVVPGFEGSVGKPPPPFPVLVLVLVLPLSLPVDVVDFGAGDSKSGGVPVGVGTQKKPLQSFPQLAVQSGAGGPGLYETTGPRGFGPPPGSSQL
jgi:hypothetical protein